VVGPLPCFSTRQFIYHNIIRYIWPLRAQWLLHRVSEEEGSIFWEVIVSVILSKKVYMYMCPIPNRFRDRAISLYRRATRHVLTRVAKCIDVDGGIFQKCIALGKLYQLCKIWGFHNGDYGECHLVGCALCRSCVYRYMLTLVPRSRIFLPWRWRRYVPPKRLFTRSAQRQIPEDCNFITWTINTGIRNST
jgi:hypothetical protein